jgi:hypothetical protein
MTDLTCEFQGETDNSNIPSSWWPFLEGDFKNRVRGVDQVVEHMFGKCKAQSSNPRTTTKKTPTTAE